MAVNGLMCKALFNMLTAPAFRPAQDMTESSILIFLHIKDLHAILTVSAPAGSGHCC